MTDEQSEKLLREIFNGGDKDVYDKVMQEVFANLFDYNWNSEQCKVFMDKRMKEEGLGYLLTK